MLLNCVYPWHLMFSENYQFRSQIRWSGLWNNPNIFGLLMGMGIALVLGAVVSSFYLPVSNDGMKVDGRPEAGNRRCRKYFFTGLCLFAAILMWRGLLHSYSRGAWTATGCGLAYLIGSGIWRLTSGRSAISCGSTISRLQSNWLPFFVILLSAILITFWHFRQTEWHPARRAFSAVNTVDFSWRNRIAAWEGALQITAEHPWFGTGWNQTEPLYEHYYLPQKRTESVAIEMNDYLILGAALGIPALFCFGMYLWLSLFRNSAFSLQPLELLPATCRAGAIVLLVGFWFDGGLFKLATASTFWILLELGRADLVPQKVTEERKANPILA
jgi:O-antigen ligase